MDLLVKLLVGIGIIWLVQTFQAVMEVQKPTNRIVLVVSTILVIIWVASGQIVLIAK